MAGITEQGNNVSIVPKWCHHELSYLQYEILPVYRTVEHFHRHKQTNEVLYTDPFYTSNGGYKATLSVYPNGYGSGKGTHVSLYIHLMKGHNDDNLPFPINGIFTVQMLNWKADHDHFERSLLFEDSTGMEIRGRVTRGKRATTGLGYSCLLSHEDMTSMNVLYEDMLCFKINYTPITTQIGYSPVPSWYDVMYSTLTTPPCTRTLYSYTAYKKTEKPCWLQPFYSAENGYKLQLRVHVNGDNGKTHLYPHVYLLKGDYDDTLSWPFNANITFQLLNWSSDSHHREITVSLKYCERVPDEESSSGGLGCHLNSIQSTSNRMDTFICNDNICFRITSVDITPTPLKDPVVALTAFGLIKSHSRHWEDIGRSLGLSQNDRAVIKQERVSLDNMLEAVLEKWIEWNGRAATWEKLIESLSEVGLGKLADIILGSIKKIDFDSMKEDSGSIEEHRLMKVAKEGLINGRSVKLRALKGILIGGPGVGKTITFKRLTNRRGNIEKDGHSRSTGVEKPDTVHLYHDIENESVLVHSKYWSPQALQGQLSTYLHCLDQQNQPKASSPLDSSTLPKTTPTLPAVTSEAGYKSTESDPALLEPNELLQQPDEKQNSTAIDLQRMQSLLKQGKLEDVEKMIIEIGEITVLYMMDLGGQPEYFEILPLLLHGPFLGIIFINLSLSLTEPFKVTYHHTESTHSTISYTASYCQINMIHQVLALIDALSPDHAPQSDTHALSLKSHACLIGTHKDSPNVSSLTISAFEKEIKESLKPCKELYHLLSMFYHNNHKANFIFPIDNFYGNETEIEGLRKALTDQIYDKFESQEINIRWAIFHLLLRSKYENPGICSLDDAVKLGLACGLENRAKIVTVLEYLHFCFGTILYYQNVPSLNDHVICDPNLIFRPLTQIIADSFGADPQTAEEIRETGIVPLETFNKACNKDSPEQHKVLSIEDLVELLKHHNILSEITQSGDSVLFMPCLLQPYSASNDDDQQLSKDGYLNAFLFSFSIYGFQPIGLFYALTAKLLSLDDFELAFVRFRDKISFVFGDASVELSSMFRYLEVRVDTDCSPAVHVNLLSILHEQIDLIMKDLPHTKTTEAHISFYCPVSIDKNAPHIAELHHVKQVDISAEPRKLKCSNCKNGFFKMVKLTKEQNMWFENPCQGGAIEKTLKDPVDSMVAYRLTKSHSSHWEDIGRSLGLDQNDRRIIEQEIRSVNSRLEAVLNKWIEIQDTPRWMTLVTALSNEGFISLSNSIQGQVSV